MMFHINLTFNHAIRGKSSLFLLPGLRGPIVQITLAFIVFIFFFLSFFFCLGSTYLCCGI